MLQDQLGLSERRACRYVGQPRSTQRRDPSVAEDDGALRAELKAFSRRRPRWGYRQAYQHLIEQGWAINRKRTQRLWREEGLRVPAKRRKRQRRGQSTVPGDRLRAERPDQVWAFDFQFDVTDDGRAKRWRWKRSAASTPTTSLMSCTGLFASVTPTRSLCAVTTARR
jgi:putative transposase